MSFLTTLGCEQKKDNYFELSIYINECPECLIELISYDPFDFSPFKVDSFYLDANGHGFEKIPVSNTTIASLIISDTIRFPIILENGFDLSVSLEEVTNQPTFNGNLSSFNDAYKSSIDLQKKYESIDNKYILSLSESDFFARLGDLKKDFDSLVNKSELKVEHESLLERIQKVQILKYQYNYTLANYDLYSSNNELPRSIQEIEEYPNFPDLLNVWHLDYGVLGQMNLDKNIYPLFWPKTNNKDSLKAFPLRVDSMILASDYDQKVKEFLVARNIYNHIKPSQDRRMLNKVLVQFLQKFEDSRYQLALESKYSDLFNLDSGSLAPNIIGFDDSNNTVKLTDFKGKIVLIDVWASWCKPCLEAMPAVQQIESQFDSNNVVFLYVSVDENRENWKKFARKYLEKKSSIIEGEETSVFYDYMLSGIPHYLLIGPNGTIIDADISLSNLEESINNLLKEI